MTFCEMPHRGAWVRLCVSVCVSVGVVVHATYAGKEYDFHLHNKNICVHRGHSSGPHNL